VSFVIGQHGLASDPIVKKLHASVSPSSEQSPGDAEAEVVA